MANTTVTNVSDLMLTNVTAGIKPGNAAVSDAQGFSEVMNNAKEDVAKVEPTDDTRSPRTTVETPKSKEIKAEEPVKRDVISNETDKAEFTEAVAQEASKIFNKIREVLGVSDEELTQAMETLGLTAIDLLDPVSIKDLAMELTETPDSISLITNAELYQNVKEIVGTAEDAVADLTAQFGIKDPEPVFKNESIKDAVKETFSDLTNNSEAPELHTNEAVVPMDGKIEIQVPIQDREVETTDADASKIIIEEERPETVLTETKTVTVEVKGTPEAKPQEPARSTEEPVTQDPLARTTTGTTETFKAAVKTEESNLKGNNEGFEHASRFAESEIVTAAPAATTVETTVNNLGDVIETVTHYTSANAEAESIMSQVTETIRVNYSPDTTSMELQLHPASLGTVNMNIASTNGVVTAHILVQNEAVKAALESQLITLQETFNEQGQKVEAVEVSVANYDLNRGTGSDTGDGNTNRDPARAGRVGTRRRINLGDLEEGDIEELSEEEKLTADMMARSGNSVDFTA